MAKVAPRRYKLHLEPDLKTFRFDGRVEIEFEAPSACNRIVLNMVDLAIWDCRVGTEDPSVACPFEVDPEKEELRVLLPEALSGNFRLTIFYRGVISSGMAGFYRSAYRYNDQTRYIGVTQFQESDARRAFPCMDHPLHKATFEIEMIIDAGLKAISNTAVAEQATLSDGRIRVAFERTPIMSTYLVFFGVGDFVIEQDSQDPRLRTVTLPGMQAYARYGMDFGRKALAYCEAFYGIGYPLSKLDLIAVPDFAFGAMENWGAITFRENLLLVYPGVTSKSGKERICEVIAHELAHQWFGNLVTPSDWSYLWLNESFATYFGYGVVAHHHPQWQTWQQFLNGQTATALARDGMHETFAIEIPGGEHVIINTSTAPIIYNKGGSILRQVEDYIGSQHFRDGLHHYLETHAYGCASSHHLWEALESVSRMPVTALMQNWVEQPGYPVITATRDGERLVLEQKRFTYLPNESDQRWLIPVNICWYDDKGGTRQEKILLNESRMEIPLDTETGAYKLNSGQSGFYRVKYNDTDNLSRLCDKVSSKELSPRDRWGLQNDLFALVRSAAIPLTAYLDILAYYHDEDAYLPLTSIAANLSAAYRTMNSEQRQQIADMAGTWFSTILAAISYDPQPDEPHTTALLRDQLIWDAACYNSSSVIEFAGTAFESLQAGKTVHPDILRSVMAVGARLGDGQTFGWLIDRVEKAASEHERQVILAALGGFQSKRALENTLAYVLEKVPPRNKFIPVTAMGHNPAAPGILWDWYTGQIDVIETFHPMIYERIVASIIPAAGIETPGEVKGFFRDYMARTREAGDVIRLSLEKLEIDLRMRNSA
jgi:tricorn protease interacting factor F2/3